MFKAKTRNSLPYFTAFIIVIIIFVLSPRLKSGILSLLSFPLDVGTSFVSDIRAMASYKFILAQNTQLRKSLSRLNNDAAAISELRLENDRLKKLLAIKNGLSHKAVAAKVIARDPNNWSMGVIINKGSESRISIGDLVVSEAGLVGRIIEVSRGASKIILLADPDNSVGAIIQRSREEGLVSGTLMGGVVMRYLEKDSDVAAGDTVLASSPGFGQQPILIGRVESVREEQQGLGKYCIIAPFADQRRIEEVLVISGNR